MKAGLRTRTPRLALLGLMLGLALVAAGQDAGDTPLDLGSYPRTELTVTQAKPARVHSFRVWVADTPQRAEQGLMFVSDLPESQGMVFPLQPPRVESMWMKNTYIELDMLFVGVNGKVAKIIERAAPLSLSTLSSGEPVAAVVELRGGAVARLGLKVGDAVSWKKPTA